MLSYQQKYSIATLLACNTLADVLERLKDNPEAVEFANSIDRFYKNRDGFVPKKVISILNK